MIERLQETLTARLPATLELLRDLVVLNSHTENRSGVNQLGRRTAERFSTLGFRREFVAHSNPKFGDHLILTRPGRTTRTVAMVSHLDTVFSPEEEALNKFHWLPEGDRIYGPGTVDIKGGTAMMHAVLSALAEVDPEAFEETTWLLLWNSAEEMLSDDFARICRSRLDPDRTLAALVFEAEGRPKSRPALVTARKGRGTFSVTVEGRSAHAGAKHPRGANAITQMGRLVDRIAGLTDYARDLTFNVGTVRGGNSVNRVPEFATAELELRAFKPEIYRDGVAAILALNGPGDVASAADGLRCQIRTQCITEIPPWPVNAGTCSLFQIWQSAANDLDSTLEAEQRGGVSDGNFLWDHVPTLDGLGPYGDNDHCSERSADGAKVPEFVLVSSIVPKAVLNTHALRRLIATDPQPR